LTGGAILTPKEITQILNDRGMLEQE
jgi:hypothetical protein